MKKKQNIVALIPARGGSKSIPEKNLSIVGNKTLLKWTIDVALECSIIDRVIVSTDNLKIKQAALKEGAEVYDRPSYLASDKSLVIDTIRYLYKILKSEGNKIDIMILLEPTSPFRDANLIKKCVDDMVFENLDSIATFHKAEIHPEKTWLIKERRPVTFINKVDPWTPRQALSDVYQLNGLVYAFNPSKLPKKNKGLLFGSSRAEIVDNKKVIDINDEIDLIIANVMLDKLK